MGLKQHESWHQVWASYPFNFFSWSEGICSKGNVTFDHLILFQNNIGEAKQNKAMVLVNLQLCFLFLFSFAVFLFLCHCVLFTVSLLVVIHLSLLRFPAGWWPVSVKGSLGTPSGPSSQETEELSALYISLSHQVISGCKWNT